MVGGPGSRIWIQGPCGCGLSPAWCGWGLLEGGGDRAAGSMAPALAVHGGGLVDGGGGVRAARPVGPPTPAPVVHECHVTAADRFAPGRAAPEQALAALGARGFGCSAGSGSEVLGAQGPQRLVAPPAHVRGAAECCSALHTHTAPACLANLLLGRAPVAVAARHLVAVLRLNLTTALRLDPCTALCLELLAVLRLDLTLIAALDHNRVIVIVGATAPPALLGKALNRVLPHPARPATAATQALIHHGPATAATQALTHHGPAMDEHSRA